MTGFGASTFEAGGAAYACTIRSVNRKHVDVAIRLPNELAALEPAIRSRVQAVCGRGDVSVVLERDRSKGARRLDVDEAAARALADAARRVAAAAGIRGEVPLSYLLGSPDVLKTTVEADAGDETVRAGVMQGVEEALTALDGMRQIEGAALERDIAGRIDALHLATEGIRREAAAATIVLTERAIAKMKALADGAGVVLEPQALANAVASLAERLDVAEELSRLGMHLVQWKAIMASEPPHGRRLDFLCQELGRELSTSSAKANSAAVSHLSVDARAELERIREQLANVL
jgi:uncharacterized protein (TIGR00255 family)